jgi:signal transduction histidine kinase
VHAFHGGRFHGVAVYHVDHARGEQLERDRIEHPIDPGGAHPVAAVIRAAKPIIWPADDPLKPEPVDLIDIFGTVPSASIFMPLNARNQLLGVLSLYREKGGYDANDVFLAEELARRAAVAIDNARLHDLVHAGVQARDDMIGIVSHDLRNPVNAVKMLTGVMLDRQSKEAMPAETVEYASVIRQAAEQMDGLIRDGVNPPYVDQKGAPYINTHLVFVPSVVVPAAFTSDGLPTGITFLGRPYDDLNMVRFAYAYEQATRHRRPPNATP